MPARNSTVLNNDELQIPENAGRTRLPKLLLIGAVLAVLIGAGVFFLRPKPVTDLYLTQPVARRDIVQRIEAAGRLDVRRRVEIPSPMEGRLISVQVRAGDAVVAGQLLAVLDERAAKLAVQQRQGERVRRRLQRARGADRRQRRRARRSSASSA